MYEVVSVVGMDGDYEWDMFEEVNAVNHLPKDKSGDATSTMTASRGSTSTSSATTTCTAGHSKTTPSVPTKSTGIKVGRKSVTNSATRSSRVGGGVTAGSLSGPSGAQSSRAGPSRETSHSYAGYSGGVMQSDTGNPSGVSVSGVSPKATSKGKGKMGQRPSSRTVKKSLKAPQKVVEKTASVGGNIRKKTLIKTSGTPAVNTALSRTPYSGSSGRSDLASVVTAGGTADLSTGPDAGSSGLIPVISAGETTAISRTADAGGTERSEVCSDKADAASEKEDVLSNTALRRSQLFPAANAISERVEVPATVATAVTTPAVSGGMIARRSEIEARPVSDSRVSASTDASSPIEARVSERVDPRPAISADVSELKRSPWTR